MTEALLHLGQFVAVACLAVGLVAFTGALLGADYHERQNK